MFILSKWVAEVVMFILFYVAVIFLLHMTMSFTYWFVWFTVITIYNEHLQNLGHRVFLKHCHQVLVRFHLWIGFWISIIVY